MAKLRCEVDSCVYNCGTCCSKSIIKIADLDESCISFHKSKKNIDEKKKYDLEIGSMDGNTNQYVSIECDELKCKYNSKRLCSSKKVTIENIESDRISEGRCKTFEE